MYYVQYACILPGMYHAEFGPRRTARLIPQATYTFCAHTSLRINRVTGIIDGTSTSSITADLSTTKHFSRMSYDELKGDSDVIF